MSKENDISIALDYDGKSAPKVTAKGRGEIARKIVEIARKHGVPVQQDVQLTYMLENVELNAEIPPALYIAVAQLLAFLYHINGKSPTDYHAHPTNDVEEDVPTSNRNAITNKDNDNQDEFKDFP
jgi:flagellar biosynthesis protein